ncbi:abasic site processing protein HMCES-like isoform X1 [Ciona intestinalis]
MCGRTACSLNADAISKSSRYRDKSGKEKEPEWKLNKDKYNPSYNKAPQSYCPILINEKHLSDNVEVENNRVIVGMRWGLVPNWFTGENVNKMSFSMNNARSDTMLEKRSYNIPLRKGQRCVVLADGFYEWNATKEGKQPYYIYFPQDLTKTTETAPENAGTDKKLLTMAGIFEKTFHDGEDLFSFTVITVDSHPHFSWLHHRMPAMLVNDDEIRDWLDHENIPLAKAVELIAPKDCLTWHSVSKFVNNSRNNGPQCIQHEVVATKKNNEGKAMMEWLSGGTTKPKTASSKPATPQVKRKASKPMDNWVKKLKKQ